MKSIAQFEYADTFTDPLPTLTTLERMEELFIAWRREIITAKNKRMRLEVYEEGSDRFIQVANELTKAELRQREIVDEIVALSGHIYAEHAALEVVK